MLNKIIAFLLAPLFFFQTLTPAFLGAKNDKSFSDADLQDLRSPADYVNYIQENGAPVFSTETGLRLLRPMTTLRRILTGKIFSDEREAFMTVKVDETFQAMYDSILEQSGFDVYAILNHVPNVADGAELLTKTFRIDTAALRAWTIEQRDKYNEKGQGGVAIAFRMFGVFLSVVKEAEVFGTPTGEPDEIQVSLRLTYKDGTEDVLYPATYINTATGKCYSKTGVGMFATGVDMDMNQMVAYGAINAWQRKFGFMLLYDLMADTSPLFNFTTRRLKFDYGNKEWMIQIWKGNYLMLTNGGELGVYNREKWRAGTYYDCAKDEELMDVTMQLSHGDEVLFSVGPEKLWWLTGFKVGKTLYLPDTLTLRFSIAFPNAEMRNAFTNAIDRHILHDISYTVDGNTVCAVW